MTNVATTSFSGFTGADYAAKLRSLLDLVDEAAGMGADIVCLPEDPLSPAGGPPIFENLTGQTVKSIGERACKHQMWVVACLPILAEDSKRVCALVFDREGTIAGQYSKMHPTIWEIDDGVLPGSEICVVDTDFGRIGLAVCYDVNWPDQWKQLADNRVKMVFWPSAYDGGFALRSLAWNHHFTVVTAVVEGSGRIIEGTGRVIAKTDDRQNPVSAHINLDRVLLHVDLQEERINSMAEALGSSVCVERMKDENLVLVESNDPDWPISRILDHWKLEPLEQYLSRAQRIQDNARATNDRLEVRGE